MKNGIYIYGIIKTSEPQEFGEIGIGNNGASRVLTLGSKDIAAVVSRCPLKAYDSLTKERVVKDLATHQLVIEKVMARFTILPVKFGTIVESEDDLITFLENSFSLLNDELSKAKGKIELDVVAWWDLQKILATISRHNEQIQAKQQEIAMKGEQASTEDKIMLGKLIEQAMQAEKARYQQVILQTLKQETVDVCLHELASDKMILNTAFLLEKNKEKSFDTAIHDLDQKLESIVNFRVVGPLPLYSFSTIVFKKIDPMRVEEAKKTLGLAGELTEKTLRDAYHQLAQKYHPDKTGGEASTENFQQIHDAYSTLKDFFEHGLIYAEVYQWKEEIQ
jgi:DnaJ-domain-containing protein 1